LSNQGKNQGKHYDRSKVKTNHALVFPDYSLEGTQEGSNWMNLSTIKVCKTC